MTPDTPDTSLMPDEEKTATPSPKNEPYAMQPKKAQVPRLDDEKKGEDLASITQGIHAEYMAIMTKSKDTPTSPMQACEANKMGDPPQSKGAGKSRSPSPSPALDADKAFELEGMALKMAYDYV